MTKFEPAPLPPATVEADGKLYMRDAQGGLRPIELVKATDQLEDETVRKIMGHMVALSDPPHTLNVYCRDLAMWRLYRNLGHDTERLKSLREGALSWLRDVAAGKVGLGDDDTAPTDTSGGVAMTDGPDRLLTRDSLRGW